MSKYNPIVNALRSQLKDKQRNRLNHEIHKQLAVSKSARKVSKSIEIIDFLKSEQQLCLTICNLAKCLFDGYFTEKTMEQKELVYIPHHDE